MPFAVSRSDTGQFVLQDPRTDTVVVDDDLLAGLEKLEAAVADKPGGKAGSSQMTAVSTDDAGNSAFGFRGSRYSLVLLAAILPFVWLALLYFALANLLSEQALGRGEQRALEDRVDALESELSALEAQAAAAPRMNKSKPRRRSEAKTPSPAKSTRLETPGEKAKAAEGTAKPEDADKAGADKAGASKEDAAESGS